MYDSILQYINEMVKRYERQLRPLSLDVIEDLNKFRKLVEELQDKSTVKVVSKVKEKEEVKEETKEEIKVSEDIVAEITDDVEVEDVIENTVEDTIEDTESETIEALRKQYENQFGKKPFMWWDAKKLKEKMK